MGRQSPFLKMITVVVTEKIIAIAISIFLVGMLIRILIPSLKELIEDIVNLIKGSNK